MLDPVFDPALLPSHPEALLFDCRTGAKAPEAYAAGHLPGAVFVDMDRDLAAHTTHPERGGRHPLPDAAVFARKVGEWGVRPDSLVIAYDDQGGASAASRFWWMLRALGHTRVHILDGGLPAAVASGLTLTAEPTLRAPAPPYPASEYQLPLADIEEVNIARSDAKRRVLDVRAPYRYRGESEPLDPIAGHIPGVHNLPFAENLRDGKFKSADELRSHFRGAFAGVPGDQVIIHCGSGVTACHTLVALERAGLKGAKLYVGSWSEWCRNPARPREP